MNMKKFIAVIMAVCIIGSTVPSITFNNSIVANAYINDSSGAVIDGLYYRTNSSYTWANLLGESFAVVYNTDKSAEEVTVPEKVTATAHYLLSGNVDETYTVKRINEGAFFKNEKIKKVNLPETINYIDQKSFTYAKNLEEINIPDGVTNIGTYAFAWCNLTNVKLPQNLTTVGDYAFGACFNLEAFEISETNKNFTVENGILFNKDISQIIVYPPAKTDDVYNVPETVKTVYSGAFLYAKNLKEVTLGEAVEDIGFSAFESASLDKLTIKNPECVINDKETTIPNTITICAPEGSTAQAYAEKYGNKFEVLEIPDVVIGDANGDNTVDLADATSIIQYIGNPDKYDLSEQGLANADCNGDGKVTGADALAIQKLEAGMIDKLPYTE